MSQSKFANRRIEAQKAKKKKQLIVIALLVVGLLVAFLTQPGDDDDHASKPAETTIKLANNPPNVSATTTTVSSSTSTSVQPVFSNAILANSVWKTDHQFEKVDPSSITNQSLFAVPAAAESPVERTATTRRNTEQVRAVYGSSDQRSALVQANESEARIFRSGDVLSDGRRAIIQEQAGVKLVNPDDEESSRVQP